jgi:two-component system, cell cycle response regulator
MSPRRLKVLVVSEQRHVLRHVSKFLSALGYEVQGVSSPRAAKDVVESNCPDFVIVDAEPDTAAAIEWCRAAYRTDSPDCRYTVLMIHDAGPDELKDALEAGVDDFLSKPIQYVELLMRLRAGARTLEFERRWRQQSGIDPLTGLTNRWALVERLKRDGPHGAEVAAGACVLVDVDFLEQFNRRYGRPGGDRLVQAVAEKLRETCEQGQMLASFGGGRFCVWLGGATDEEAAQWAQRVRAALAETDIDIDGTVTRITASFGVAASNHRPGTVDDLLDHAVRALDDSKSAGRDCVTRFGELDADTKAWAESVGQGKLLEQAVARNLMTPCTLVLQSDYALSRAAAMVRRTGLAVLPVVDAEGKLAGVLTSDEILNKTAAGKDASVLVGDVMNADVTVVQEDAGFAVLRDLLIDDSCPVVVVTWKDRPVGCVTSNNLATLGARITAESFAPAQPYDTSSSYLVVPDPCTVQCAD